MSSAAIDFTFGQPSMDAVDALDPLFTNMDADVEARVQGALYAGLLNGTNPNDLAGELVDCLSPARATTIARTEMLGAYRTAALDAYRANSDVVGQWMWSASRGGACIACLEMDGEVFSLDEEMDGMTHPNCRCSPIPITSSWGDILGPLGIDASGIEDTSILDDYETGAEWFAKQDAATQIDALGSKAAYEAVQAGEVAPRDFVGVRHDEQYGNSIYTKSLKEAREPNIGTLGKERLQADIAEQDKLLAELRTPRISEVEQELQDAQARLADLVRSGASRDDIYAAKWDVAKRQAAVDLENGGRGVNIVVDNVTPSGTVYDPLDTKPFEQTTQKLFGRQLTRDEIGGLVGAPEGSFVQVYVTSSEDSLSFAVRGPDWDPMQRTIAPEFDALRYLERDQATGDLVMHNASFLVRADMQGGGLGARIFADEVQTLSNLDVKYIETHAVGAGVNTGLMPSSFTQGANGYYTWPRFGYAGPLPQEALNFIQRAILNGDVPADWSNFTTIQEVMQAPGGRAWWKDNGVPLHLRFDLSDGSYSRRTLENYLKQRGLQ